MLKGAPDCTPSTELCGCEQLDAPGTPQLDKAPKILDMSSGRLFRRSGRGCLERNQKRERKVDEAILRRMADN